MRKTWQWLILPVLVLALLLGACGPGGDDANSNDDFGDGVDDQDGMTDGGDDGSLGGDDMTQPAGEGGASP